MEEHRGPPPQPLSPHPPSSPVGGPTRPRLGKSQSALGQGHQEGKVHRHPGHAGPCSQHPGSTPGSGLPHILAAKMMQGPPEVGGSEALARSEACSPRRVAGDTE